MAQLGEYSSTMSIFKVAIFIYRGLHFPQFQALLILSLLFAMGAARADTNTTMAVAW